MTADPAGRRAVAGIVLAGGRSRRFGEDKLARPVDGRPLLHHAIHALVGLVSEVLVVVAPGAQPALPTSLPVAIRVVHDPEAFGGPLVGLGAALAAATHPLAIVVGGDMPRLVPAVLARLVVAVQTGGPGGAVAHAAILEVAGDRIQPLPTVLDVDVARDVSRRVIDAGGRSLRALLLEMGPVVVPATVWREIDPTGATVADIDLPAELDGLADLDGHRRGPGDG